MGTEKKCLRWGGGARYEKERRRKVRGKERRIEYKELKVERGLG